MKFTTVILPVFIAAITALAASAQDASLEGRLLSGADKSPVAGADIFVAKKGLKAKSDRNGIFSFEKLPAGRYSLTIIAEHYRSRVYGVEVEAGERKKIAIELEKFESKTGEVTVTAEKDNPGGIGRLNAVEGTAIYEGKKNEVIYLSDINANFATNNTRQIFSKVPGINIIENDGGGIQLGVAVRGLNPNRITEFNSRQNGYDISADALGYPESYYTPPTEGVQRIEVVRGAASLQYGSQFGGLLNFVMKEGSREKEFELQSTQTGGSFGLLNSFNSIGGTTGDLNYYGFYHHKQGNAWRENSAFNINSAYSSLKYSPGESIKLGAELTFMKYRMQQPGGLSDQQFAQNARQSVRDRNWFSAQWLLPVLTLDYSFSATTRLNTRAFSLIANRSSIGNLIAPNRPDTPYRNLMIDEYMNFGVESRFIHSYELFGNYSTGLLGVRYYQGNTHRMQGLGSDGSDADFSFLNPGNLESVDYRFPSSNLALFAEHIFTILENFSITPGARYEHILTNADGYYKVRGTSEKNFENRSNSRGFFLLGLGMSYYPSEGLNIYANISQAYSGVNFNDMRVSNSSLRVNPDLHDVTGYNIDYGIRGKLFDVLNIDLGGFYLAYNGRIGLTPPRYDTASGLIYRLRTNIADSRSVGVESFAELELFRVLGLSSLGNLSVFGTLAYVDARYINTADKSVYMKKVEYAPEIIARPGLSYSYHSFSVTAQMSYVSEQFTDATNSKAIGDGVTGPIPAYSIIDISAGYSYDILLFNAGVNNLFNEKYFTRRADGYPGPGILPSDARNFYFSIGIKR